MKKYDENIHRQLDKPQAWFVKYFLIRIVNATFEQKIASQEMYDFKDDESIEFVVHETVMYVKKAYGKEC